MLAASLRFFSSPIASRALKRSFYPAAAAPGSMAFAGM
jgi:hypothetical protein